MHARIVRAALEAEQGRALLEALAVADGRGMAKAPRSAAADPMRLRGLPAIGPGVSGAIHGTVPHRNRRLDRWGGRKGGHERPGR